MSQKKPPANQEEPGRPVPPANKQPAKEKQNNQWNQRIKMCLGHSYQTDFQFNITNIHNIYNKFELILFSESQSLSVSYNIFCCFLWLLAVFDFTHKISLFASFCFLISGTAAQVTSRAQPTNHLSLQLHSFHCLLAALALL